MYTRFLSHLRWCIFASVMAMSLIGSPTDEQQPQPDSEPTRTPCQAISQPLPLRYDTALINDIIASYDQLDGTTDMTIDPIDEQSESSPFLTWTKRLVICACIAGALYAGYALLHELYTTMVNHASQEAHNATQQMRDDVNNMTAQNQALQEQFAAMQQRVRELEEALPHRCPTCGLRPVR